jgi:hypothetical protein
MKLSWSQLEALLDGLTDDYASGKLDITGYIDEWNELVDFAGWTWEEFADEVDKRWTQEKKHASLLFKC